MQSKNNDQDNGSTFNSTQFPKFNTSSHVLQAGPVNDMCNKSATLLTLSCPRGSPLTSKIVSR